MFRIGGEVLFVLALVIANGVFAMSEIAVVSALKARLQQRAQEGDMRARQALELANAPERFLSTVQIGITLVGILAGCVRGSQDRGADRSLPGALSSGGAVQRGDWSWRGRGGHHLFDPGDR
ncbi:hypothetical protein BH23GEM5_BH23GEM5_29340 [soil metagenome]